MENELFGNVERRDLESVENYVFEEIKGYPMLRWKGKRPYTSTSYFPAQLKEVHGEEVNGWLNKIFWGDNLQVMSHLLKQYRGKVDLIYIDPPFDSKADYKKTIQLRGKKAQSDSTNFEEKQYGDIWANDEYLQYMYERLVIMRELLSDTGSIYLHCDWHKVHHLRCIMDEIFGAQNFKNEVIWGYRIQGVGKVFWGRKHDDLLFYTKTDKYTFHAEKEDVIYEKPFIDTLETMPDMNGLSKDDIEYISDCIRNKVPLKDKYKSVLFKKYYANVYVRDIWDCDYTKPIISGSSAYLGYPTQKPEGLLERIIKASSNPGDIVFDCFMGSGTTQAAALKLGRRFIGADINLGAIETTTKRLLNIAKEIKETIATDDIIKYTGFEVYNVNNYDVFRNPVQAHDLLVQALELQPLPNSSLYDGEKDGRMWKILSVNRVATRADLTPLIANFDYKLFEERRKVAPNKPVEKITLVCMGHEPDLADTLELELKKSGYLLDVEVLDILRDKQDIQFRRDSEAEIVVESGKLVIRSFYPMNLLNKLSWETESVDDWRVLVDSIKIDFNYDGAIFCPTLNDIPEKSKMVSCIYKIPANAGTIRVKITDILSESLEQNVEF